ncbi:endothelin-converting enzyme 1-like [Ornithodoros turicata]|uniref:endothelin-converting enzyme 1-like n=1 Tax=Ornithodoros turicata TaxID=34597 RepID=UPI003138D605
MFRKKLTPSPGAQSPKVQSDEGDEEGPARASPIRSHPVQVGVLASTILFLYIVYLTIESNYGKEKVIRRTSVCDNAACQLYAYHLQRSIAAQVDPCTNFYDHVCGSWKPPRDGQKSVGQALYEYVMVGVRSWSERHALSRMNRATLKASRLLKACLESIEDFSSNIGDLIFLMEGVSLRWPHPPDLQAHPLEALVQLAARWRTEFVFKVALRVSNVSKVIYFYPGELVHHFVDQKMKDDYHDYLSGHAEMLGLSITRKESASMMKTAKQVGRKMAALKRKLHGEQHSLFTIQSAQNITTEVNAETWLTFLNSHIHLSDDTDMKGHIGLNDKFFVTDIRVFEALDGILKMNRSELLNYIGWKIVELFGDAFFSDAAFRGNKGLDCCARVEAVYGYALTAYYTMAVLTDDYLNKTTALFKEVSDATRELLLESGWSNSSVGAANRKLAGMTHSAWIEGLTGPFATLDNLYNDFPIRVENFVKGWMESNQILWNLSSSEKYNLYTVTSYPSGSRYIYDRNGAVLPTTLVFEPMFAPSYVEAIKLAGLGAVYAETITRAFDGSGVAVDSWLQLQQWMSPSEYLERRRCYKADSRSVWSAVALPVVLRALKNTEHRTNYGPQKLINFTSYSREALFFMAYCFASCSLDGADEVYSIRSKEACNYALQQSTEFAEAFQCPVGTPMNPEDKCKFW